MVFAAAA